VLTLPGSATCAIIPPIPCALDIPPCLSPSPLYLHTAGCRGLPIFSAGNGCSREIRLGDRTDLLTEAARTGWSGLGRGPCLEVSVYGAVLVGELA
jgi:hypothetical protein